MRHAPAPVRHAPGGGAAGSRTAAPGAAGLREVPGPRWARGTSSRARAETTRLSGTYVRVGFWRTVREGILDREVVVRMAAPTMSRVAEGIRDRTYSQ
ncbi:hypothetical protein Ate01nite_17930 [Actinoplanes teichomyceticus]|nr:hypothetical protein Ate01nite_17930 [Actinoplanes teichomyceticus]